MTSFRILGPIEVWSTERRLAVGGPRQVALLAFLLVHANRAVPSDALVDALWGPARAGADNRLQMAVARLRKALAPLTGAADPLVRTVHGGYLLAVDAGQLDAEVFAARVRDGLRALEAGEPALAADALSEALGLWRGPVLAEVSFEDFAQGEIRGLEELHLAALEARIDADLRLGRHARLVGELEGLLAEHPVRERVAALLMLALYRSQRQADALEVYHRIRLALAEQLGLEPGPALKELQAEILGQDPSLQQHAGNGSSMPLAPSAGAPAQAPHAMNAPFPSRLEPYGPPVFVDRNAEREVLEGALELAATSGPRAAFVTGEPGIGKTRLVSEVARRAHADGALVLAGRCDEGLELPYQPFVEALEHLVEHASRDLLEAHAAQYGKSLARLVPALVPAGADGVPPMPRPSESERYVLFRAIEGLLAVAAGARGMVLVLEDLHWADLPTLKLLRRLLASSRRSRLMLLCTCRVSELHPEHPLRELLADLHREPYALRVGLRGLGTDDVAGLLRGMADGPVRDVDEQLVTALESSTNGNPFFITELARSLIETGAIASEEGRWRMSARFEPDAHLPPSITETLARRLQRMDHDVRCCLRAAAVIGEQFDLDVVSDLQVCDSAADALDRAVENAVLLEVPGRPVRFRFNHALMQRYLYGELGPARRSEIHTRVAMAMEARLEEGRWPVAELARHWMQAGDAQPGRALGYAVQAGDEALAKLAPDEARRWYQLSLELLARQSDPSAAEQSDLLVRRGVAERHAGDRGFRETLLQAADLAQRTGNGPVLVRAALANTRGMQSETGIVDEARIGTLDAALQIVGEHDSAERARLLAMQAAELMYSGQWERRVRLSDEALAIARRLGDRDALSLVLNMRFVTLLAPQTHAERQANTVEAVAAASRLNDPLAHFYACHWRGYACLEAGDTPGARSWMAREREIAEGFREPTALWLARADQANLAIVAGQLDLAQRLASDAFELGRHSEPDAAACYAAQQTSIAFEAGRLGRLVPLLEQAVRDNPGVPGFSATLALALAEDLRFDEAKEIVGRAAASNFGDVRADVTWLAVACIYAYVSSRLGHLPASRRLYELLEPWKEQIAFPAFGVWGPVHLYLGALAVAIGDLARAQRHLESAARAANRAGAPIWEARAASQLIRVTGSTA